MDENPFKTKDFKRLQKEWMDKLGKETDFVDIEDGISPREWLKRWDHSYFQDRYTPESFTAKQRYFDDCRALLHSESFKSKLEESVWALHSEGRTLREISVELRDKKNRLNKDKVHEIVTRFRKKLGIK